MQCPVCLSDDHVLITDRVRFGHKADVLKCRECSLVFLDRDSFKLPEDFYESDYHQTYITHVEPSAFDPESYFKKMLTATRPWADRINEMLTGKEKVLDFGCSTGHLLTLIKDRAAEVHGFEVNKKEIEFCQKVLGLDVSGEPLEGRYNDGAFDYISMIFVLEHIAEPVDLLKSLGRFLKPGGRFIILVPNVNDALLNFYQIPEYAQFYFCMEHLFYYSATTLGRILEQAGVKATIEVLQEYPVTNHLNWGYRKKPSDVLASRRAVPDIPIADSGMVEDWEGFWRQVDKDYKGFLAKRGYGDRLLCVAGRPEDR